MGAAGNRRLLLIGASGQVGAALESAFADSAALLATARQHPRAGHVPLDLADAKAVRDLVREWSPDVTVIAGAMCDVDGCETQPDVCGAINVEGPRAVAEVAQAQGSRVVLFSTDHVFDGSRSSYREDDEPRPLSVYARSKLDAEIAVRSLLPGRHLIVRTGWVYGPDRQRRNFILRLVDRIRAGERVNVPEDQWGSPTHTHDLAAATRALVDGGVSGTFHATGPEFVDRVALARRVCGAFALDPDRVVPVATAALGQAAPRSLRVRLDCGKLRSFGAPPFRDIAAGLQSMAEWSATTAEWQRA
jgi:dTDP-4-dehydrorhamnose reductase